MNIDFHHAVTYVLARLAGFCCEDADIIAYSAQYVDDAVIDRLVHFKNGATFKPLCSAHKMLDYRNFDSLANHTVWLPFHFLPGNAGLPEGEGRDLDFIDKIICFPNSYIAQDMVKECIRNSREPNGLHRLGVTMHVYADTWAHQGFAGVQNVVNVVGYLHDDKISKTLLTKLSSFFEDLFELQASAFVGTSMPLGHGPVLSYPDRPYLTWRYKNYNGVVIERTNWSNCLEAAENMFLVMKRFQLDNPEAEVEGLSKGALAKFSSLFKEIIDDDPEARHQEWLKIIKKGEFDFGSETLSYVPTGPGSWEYDITQGEDIALSKLNYDNNFLRSNWKKFNDALVDHYYYLHRVLFPRYGIFTG